MKTSLLLLVVGLMVLSNVLAQNLKKAELPPSYRQKSTLHVLDSILWSHYNSGTYNVLTKEVITGRVTGAEYLWSEKLRYSYDVYADSLRLMTKFKQTYLENSVNAPVETYLTYPWNTTLNAWDDTMSFIKFTGDTNYTLNFVIYTDQIDKSYDYNQNKFVYGSRYKIQLLNDTCPSQQEIFFLDTVNNVFLPYQKVMITYDNNWLVDSVIFYSYDDVMQQYNLVFLMLYTFSGNLITERLIKYWDGIQWVDSQKELLTYDANGNEIEFISLMWDIVLNTWKNSYKSEKTYNANNLLLTDSQYSWDDVQNAWVPVYKQSFDYDLQGNITLKEFFSSDGLVFVPMSKYEYAYDANNNVINETYSYWDAYISAYSYSFKNDYFYTGTFLDSIYSYSYDSYNQNWILSGKTEFEYDSYQELVREEYFGLNGNLWEPIYKIEYFYSDISSIVNHIIYNNFIQVYPNPTSQYLNIHFNRLDEVDAVNIYNTEGRLIKKFNKLSILAPINISDLSSGTYIIHLVSGNKQYQSKFIKE